MNHNACGSSTPPDNNSGKAASNGCGTSKKKAPNSCGSSGGKTKPATTVPLELHACMGLNACKGHDRFGNNECAGMGFCATISHACHSLNNCRGQGGCGFYGSSHQQAAPADNPCAWFGSCAVPINAERLLTDGEFKEKTVWARARVVFEKRMTEQSQRQFGPSPFPDGPPQWWLDDVGSSSSCSASASSTTVSSDSCATKISSGGNSCGSSKKPNSCGSSKKPNSCGTAKKPDGCASAKKPNGCS